MEYRFRSRRNNGRYYFALSVVALALNEDFYFAYESIGGGVIGIYFEKARQLIKSRKAEQAISTFLEGLDKGDVKCAYGVLDAVINVGSLRIGDDEAISIFQAAYPTIKELAEQGDAEAMFIVGEGIRYGIVDDDEPYMLWLNEASRRGNTDAASELAELDSEECPTSLDSPQAATQTHLQEVRSGGADIVLIDDKLLSNECTLISDADWLVREELGIEEFLADKLEEKRKMLYEHQGLDIEEDYKCLQEAE